MKNINIALREILSEMQEKCLKCTGGDCMNCEQKNINREEAYDQIKVLVIESLGEEKKFLDLDVNIQDVNDYVRHKERTKGRNQKIVELKEKWE